MAHSRSFCGGITGRLHRSLLRLPCLVVDLPVIICRQQSTLVHITRPGLGSATTPASGNEGPIARRITVFDSEPTRMNPPIGTLSPPKTWKPGGNVEELSGVGVTMGHRTC